MLRPALLMLAFALVCHNSQAEESDRLKRGEYLVHHVAQCVACHSPRNNDGELIQRKLLMGATIPIESPYPGRNWAFQSPRLAGLPGWERDRIITLLKTGRRPNGRAPNPPMPEFRMTEEDATAVVDYLLSLK